MQKRIVSALVTVAVAVLALLVSGQPKPIAANAGGQSLAGSWRAIVMQDPPLPPGYPQEGVLCLATFTPDGGVISSDGFITDSPGYGTWVRTGNRQFAVTMLALTFGPSGHTEGTLKVRQTLAYTESGLELTGRWVIDVGDPNGNNWVTVLTGTARYLPINVEKIP